MDATTEAARTSEASKARRISFYVLLVLFTLMHAFLSPLPFAVLGLFVEVEPGGVSHRLHEIIFGWVFALSIVGLLVHVRRPQEKVAGMYQVMIAIWLIAAATLVVDRLFDPVVLIFLIIPVLLLALHPGRARLLRPSVAPSKVLVGLTVVAAVPLLFYSFTEFRIGLEASRIAPEIFEDLDEDSTDDEFNEAASAGTSTNEEFEQVQHYGHWSAMGAFALIVVGLSAVASLRVPGWRLTAWSAGLSAILYGGASITFPGDASAANSFWAALAIAWGTAFIVAAERDKREPTPANPADLQLAA